MSGPVLKAAAERMEIHLHNLGIVGFDPMILIQLLPSLISLFQSCKQTTPPKPIPIPDPTPSQAKAWEMKSRATEGFDADTNAYDRRLLHATAQTCRKTRKKNGASCKPREALELARTALDEARNNDIDTIAAAIDEADSQ